MNSVDFPYGTDDHNLARTIAMMWSSWNGARQKAITDWREITSYVYATSTRDTTNKANDWNHTTHIPKLTQIFDNLGANYASALFSGPSWFAWEGADGQSVTKQKVRAIENYLTTKHRQNNFENEMLKLLNDWVMYGNCFAWVEYVVESTIDPDDGSLIAGYEGPRIMRISPYDIVFNPTATSFQKSPKIIREVISRGDLIRAVEEKPELEYDPEVVLKVLERRRQIAEIDQADINKQVQNRFDGFDTAAAYYQSDSIELLHFYGDIFDDQTGEFIKNSCITIVDQHCPIRVIPQKTYSGYPNIFHCGWRLRPDNLWAMGPLANLIGMQYYINHLENARADAFDQMLSPDEVFIGNVQEQQEGPVRRFFVDDTDGSVTLLRPDPTVLQADMEIQYKEAQMEAYAGAPREAMGIRSPGEKTAFEVNQLLSAAGKLFQHKIEYFERQFLEPILNAELEVARRNLNGTDVIQTIDDDFGVIEFMDIKKEDLTGKGKLTPVGARHYSRQALLAQQLKDFSNILANDPGLAVHFPAKARAEAWEELLGTDKLGQGLFQPFGGIYESVEAQQVQQTALEAEASVPDGLEIDQMVNQ